ncbi:hypothetical protein DPX39_100052100 [Trypanosoma brucei equiperdum]|uniref:Calponin-homology (CH) domain-containing protein n=1 Tax=Trypanosoma brucei equiperdum TaxID=630700 RepID=A0A3L6KWU9_9TRYP|nr:hypothetical protein DPX39_100052100 [Trypanosoma brucei equiperdum]
MSASVSPGAASQECGAEGESGRHNCGFEPRNTADGDGRELLVREALSLLGRMRVDLSHIKESANIRDNTERTMSLRANRSLVLKGSPDSKRLKGHVSSCGVYCGGALFFPLPTAPMTSLMLGSDEGRAVRHRPKQPAIEPCTASAAPPTLPLNKAVNHKGASKGDERILQNPAGERQGLPVRKEARHCNPNNADDCSDDSSESLTNCSAELAGSVHENVDDVTRSDELKVRDYLRRLNIVEAELSESEEPINDPVLNGSALRRLLLAALHLSNGNGETFNPVHVAPPKCLDDVRLNYVAAMGTLRNLRKVSGVSVPHECRIIKPESVLVKGKSRVLFSLLRVIIEACFPTTCEKLWSSPSLTWQVDSTAVGYQPSAMRRLEREVCDFLYLQKILPDPVAHRLPPDDAIVPPALQAPFLPPQRRLWCLRRDSFSSLYIPSVFPFLTNGAALCDLVDKVTGSHLPVHRNPRIKSNCIDNIKVAFDELHRYCPARMSSLFLNEAHRVYHGDRCYILLLLEDIMRFAADVPPRRQPPKHSDAPYFPTASAPSTTAPPPQLQLEVCVQPRQQEQRRQGAGHRLSKSQERRVARCLITSPLTCCAAAGSKGRKVGDNVASTAQTTAPAPVVVLSGLDYATEEVEELGTWVTEVLGSDFRYVAADQSFSFSCRSLWLRDYPVLFSDGVVLAHLIRTLQRRPCVELESIELQAKSAAAKRRNLRKCISYLQTEKRILLDVPLLDEMLLSGSLQAVLYVVQSLKNTYRLAVRG